MRGFRFQVFEVTRAKSLRFFSRLCRSCERQQSSSSQFFFFFAARAFGRTTRENLRYPGYRKTNFSIIRNPHKNEQILTVPTHNLPRYNEYFVLSLAVSKNDMMIRKVDKPNTIDQDSQTLTFKALLCLDVAVHGQVCSFAWCISYCSAWFSLVTPLITNIFVVNQIIRYNGVFAITKTPL